MDGEDGQLRWVGQPEGDLHDVATFGSRDGRGIVLADAEVRFLGEENRGQPNSIEDGRHRFWGFGDYRS